VLLEAGRAAEAEAIYWQDLKRNRENGWSLFGLKQSLQAQGKEEEALAIEERFHKAWNQADVHLTASRFMDEARTTVATTQIGGSGVSQ
jgi:tetratricopeptide (TPR) repeat protein